jgi:hypothetical protein
MTNPPTEEEVEKSKHMVRPYPTVWSGPPDEPVAMDADILEAATKALKK